jgi:hypothetical protein
VAAGAHRGVPLPGARTRTGGQGIGHGAGGEGVHRLVEQVDDEFAARPGQVMTMAGLFRSEPLVSASWRCAVQT